jgi:uncharacterized protein with von Willebrand factor type A (vWA) domain
MFASFFYLLRARGLDVSLSEWLTLVEAMDKGLCHANFTEFYYLARSVLVKSEADFDKFDGVFLEYFKNIAFTDGELPVELLNWLNNPDHEMGTGASDNAQLQGLSPADIRRMLAERLKEQDAEHNGGKYWIGTDGASPFGNAGNAPKGIRVGGESRRRMAMEVAGAREFRDFRDDAVLDTRSFQLAFRRLRQFSNRVDAPRTELDLNASIAATCNNCGRLKLVFDKPRKNTVKLLLMMDSGGSMDMYSGLCAALFQAVSKSNHFSDLKVYYFHNCFRDSLYKSPQIYRGDSVQTSWVLQNLSAEYRVIIVGDALMDIDELMGRGYNNDTPSALEWLRIFRQRYRHLVWLSPEHGEHFFDSYWGKSYKIIQNELNIRALTVESLTEVVKSLMVTR